MTTPQFSSLALQPELLSVLTELGFEGLTPIQSESLPSLLAGKDLIGQSKTGSGKTAAFALPILNKVDLQSPMVQGLILCPTRELAAQVVGEVRKLGRKLVGLRVLALTGGESGRAQSESLENGVQIAVGTPGRVLDLLERGRLDVSFLKTLVLDEADRMLEMGFEDEISKVVAALPAVRQTALFSATFPDSIQSLSRRYQKNPVRITIEESDDTLNAIAQFVYDAELEYKVPVLMRILQQHAADSVLIFCNMKVAVHEIAAQLEAQGASYTCLHGELEQREREKVMAMFRNGSYRIMVATDVAARGLDIEDLGLVINFDLPQQPEIYLHRIGRTGRAGESGIAVAIANKKDSMRLAEFEGITRSRFQRPHLGFQNQLGVGRKMQEPAMRTISIGGGRKDKLRPGDILGALTGGGGGLTADEVGKIQIFDNITYAAVANAVASTTFKKLQDAKIKGKKFQVRLLK